MKYHKGRYIPHNKQKYIGDITNIIYRSSWERRFMKYCDTNSSIIEWSSEELYVPYVSPIDNKYHRYYPDFIIKVKSKKSTKIIMIEIKPSSQTKRPEKGRKKNTTYLSEIRTWTINTSKWKHALKYCAKKNWEFKILTEEHIL